MKITVLYFLPLSFTYFHWRIVALQCCVGFRLTAMWISHKHIYILCPKLPPACPATPAVPELQSGPLGSPAAHPWLYHLGNVCVSELHCWSSHRLLPLRGLRSLFSILHPIPALKISSAAAFSRLYTHASVHAPWPVCRGNCVHVQQAES